jgi:hypothetical protein
MTRIDRLAEKFREQEEFAADYSPLYSILFGTVASWLQSPDAARDPLVQWLVEISHSMRSLNVTLLLAAGLHKNILASKAESMSLAQFFPSAGGNHSPGLPKFVAALREAIWNDRQQLADFMNKHQVQTNETGRGLCWLLPLYDTGWPAVQLVDLGASAGLNLLADQRAYRLIASDGIVPPLDIGLAEPVQFEVRLRSKLPLMIQHSGQTLPSIVSRTGCDLAPFPLETEDDELTLTSFVWADQVERIQRLREGFSAFFRIRDSNAPVRLLPADLPDQAAAFLQARVPTEMALPVVINNTYMTVYLHDRGRSLGSQIGEWAQDKDHPVLWLQWEPLHSEQTNAAQIPPEPGWCVWTADLWANGQHHHWRLGWAHPHGKSIELSQGFVDWQEYWKP